MINKSKIESERKKVALIKYSILSPAWPDESYFQYIGAQSNEFLDDLQWVATEGAPGYKRKELPPVEWKKLKR